MFQALLFLSRRASFTVAVILLPFSCHSLTKSEVPVGPWSDRCLLCFILLRMAHVTVVCTFETCINQKSLLFICGVIAALEALIGLCHTIFFSSVHTRSAAARPRQWRRYLWEVELECQFCVCFLCLWLEWRQSVYVKVCWWLKVCGFISKQ